MADYAPVDLTAEGQVEFELNGTRVSAPAGTMLADAAFAHGVEVPIFCYEPRLGAPIGACRMCLVEIEGMRGLQTACSTPVQPDMVVRTNSEIAKDGQDVDGVESWLYQDQDVTIDTLTSVLVGQGVLTLDELCSGATHKRCARLGLR